MMKETIEFYRAVCAHCGVSIPIDRKVRRRLVKEGGVFYCLNGHANKYLRPKPKEPTATRRRRPRRVSKLSRRQALAARKAQRETLRALHLQEQSEALIREARETIAAAKPTPPKRPRVDRRRP